MKKIKIELLYFFGRLIHTILIQSRLLKTNSFAYKKVAKSDIADFFIRRGWRYRKFGAPLFNLVMIQTTYYCNKKCPFCYYGLGKDKLHKIGLYMEDETFISVIDQLEKIRYSGKLALFEINEPLTDKNIIDRLEFARSRLPTAWHHMVSNGEIGTFNQYLKLANLLDKLEFSSYSETSLKNNEELIRKLRIQNVRAELVNNDHTPGKVDYISRGGNVEEYLKVNAVTHNCELSHQVLMIKPSGDVLSCWNDFYHVNVMGNVQNEKILDIWYGKQFIELRNKLVRNDRSCSTLCAQCDYEGWGGFHYPKGVEFDYNFSNRNIL